MRTRVILLKQKPDCIIPLLRTSRTRPLSLATIDIWGQVILHCKSCPVFYRIAITIPGSCPLGPPPPTPSHDNQKCLQMLPNVSQKAKLPLFRSTAIKSDHLEWSRGSDMITCCVIWAHTVLPLFTELSPSCLPTGNWAVLWVNAIIIGSIQQGQEYVERLPSFDRIGCVPGCELSTQSWLVLIELPSCGIPDVWDVGQGPEKCLPSASTCDQWPLRKG